MAMSVGLPLSLFLVITCVVAQNTRITVLSNSIVNDYETSPAADIPTFFFQYQLSATLLPDGGFIVMQPAQPQNSLMPNATINPNATYCASPLLTGSGYLKLHCLPGTGNGANFVNYTPGTPIWAVLYKDVSENGTADGVFILGEDTPVSLTDASVTASFCTVNAGPKGTSSIFFQWPALIPAAYSPSGAQSVVIPPVVCSGYCFLVARINGTVIGTSDRLQHGSNVIDSLDITGASPGDIVYFTLYDDSNPADGNFNPNADNQTQPIDTRTEVPITLVDWNRVFVSTLVLIEDATVVPSYTLQQAGYIGITDGSTGFFGVSSRKTAGAGSCLMFTFPSTYVNATDLPGIATSVTVGIYNGSSATFNPAVSNPLPATPFHQVAISFDTTNQEQTIVVNSVETPLITGTIDGVLSWYLSFQAQVICKGACYLVLWRDSTPIGASNVILHGSYNQQFTVYLQQGQNFTEGENLTLVLHYAGNVNGGTPDCTSNDFFANGAAGNPAVNSTNSNLNINVTVPAVNQYWLKSTVQTSDLVVSAVQNNSGSFVIEAAFASDGGFVVAYDSSFCGSPFEYVAYRDFEFVQTIFFPVITMRRPFFPAMSPFWLALHKSNSPNQRGRFPANDDGLVIRLNGITINQVREKGITQQATYTTDTNHLRRVIIDQAVLGGVGFVAVHLDDGNGFVDPNVVIGASNPLNFGLNTNIYINVSRDLVDDEQLWAVLHIDAVPNGSPYNPSTDSAELPLVAPLIAPFTVDIQQASATPTPTAVTTGVVTTGSSSTSAAGVLSACITLLGLMGSLSLIL